MPVTPVTGKFGSSSIGVFMVDGYNLLAAKVQGIRYKIESLQEKSDGAGDVWDEHTPTGHLRAELAQEGAYFDTSAGNSHAALVGSVPSSPQVAQRVIVLGLAKSLIGQPIMGFQGAYSHEYEVLAQNGNLTRANVTYRITGAAEEGVILHALTTETADATTEPGSSVDNALDPTQPVIPIVSSVAAGDLINTSAPHNLTAGDTVVISGHSGSTPALNGAQTVLAVTSLTQFSITTDITVGGTGGTLVQGKSNRGGAGYLEVEALTLGTFTDALVTIRHSADNTTFADLVSFTARTLFGAERVAVAGAVNRYLAQNVDFRGAGSGGSIKYVVGFARA
jgi:hypothetical protein